MHGKRGAVVGEGHVVDMRVMKIDARSEHLDGTGGAGGCTVDVQAGGTVRAVVPETELDGNRVGDATVTQAPAAAPKAPVP